MKKPELLMPAGSLEVLQTVIMYGADAVYIGADSLSLRAKAKNFTWDEVREGLTFAHAHGARVYMAANIFAHNEDMEAAKAYFLHVHEMEEKPDAFIISDPGLWMLHEQYCPEVPVHISTQANNTNYGTYRFWYEHGVRRVVSARELSLAELKEIRRQIPADMEIESFVHGAMCISYSGRCLISSFLTGRDANRGSCTHPCRWKYYLTEETRPGQYMPVEEDERGTYLYNSKDLCMINHVPELMEAGIDSWKVEGRMKTVLYAATIARAYRHAIDDYLADPALYESRRDWYASEVMKCTTRSLCTGFYFGKPDADSQIYGSSTYHKDYTYFGTIRVDEKGPYILQKNKFSVGDVVEKIRPDGTSRCCTVLALTDEEGNRVESAPHPGQKLYLTLDAEAQPYDIIRGGPIMSEANDRGRIVL